MSVPRHAASQLRRELAQHHDGSTFTPDRILTTLHAVLDEPETAVALLAEVWPAVPPDVEQDWIRRTSDVGTHLLTVLPTSQLLATTFRRAARTMRAHGHLRLAAIHGMRELAIHRQRDDDPDATAASLHDLAETCRAQGRMHKVIGCADETLETYLLHGYRPGVARTLAHLACASGSRRSRPRVRCARVLDPALKPTPSPSLRSPSGADSQGALADTVISPWRYINKSQASAANHL
ncbi:hypothetical protein AB0H12_31225 [Actinosynnema sp. NPDC023794]